jgi:hypothetical protein
VRTATASEAAMTRDHARARRVWWRISVCVLLSSLTGGLSTAAWAGSELSPVVRIVVLEAGVTPNTLRLGVRKRNMLNYPDPAQLNSETLDTEILNFNPASCTQLQFGYVASGAAVPTQYDVFDVQLNPAGRTAEEQRQLLNAVLASFVDSNDVQLYVRDDLCTSSGGRVVAGIVVN